MSKVQNVDVENSELKIENHDHKQIFKLKKSWIKCSKVKKWKKLKFFTSLQSETNWIFQKKKIVCQNLYSEYVDGLVLYFYFP